ncbi:ras-related protein Rab-15-like isoform 1-T1 [Pholidichthys leucotaenia]
MKTVEIDGFKVRVQIWDTAGQERYQTITKQYYRRAAGIIFVYDITNEQSFKHIANWVTDVDESVLQKMQTILVGNKSDEESRREVTKEQGRKLAEYYGMDFFESSAATSVNITESFMRLTELVLHAYKRESLSGFLEEHNLLAELGSQNGGGNSQRNCAC